jgi:hypothetical protein
MDAARQALNDHDLMLTGTLASNGEARMKVIDSEGHTVPVLVLDLQGEAGVHMPMHIEQLFPPGHMTQAQAAARRYRKGLRVTVQAPVLSVRIAVTASHIHTEKTEP